MHTIETTDPKLPVRADGSPNEAYFKRPTTDSSFADILDRGCSVLGCHRNVSLVRRSFVAASTGPALKPLQTLDEFFGIKHRVGFGLGIIVGNNAGCRPAPDKQTGLRKWRHGRAPMSRPPLVSDN
jgi:hypothetical protein